jgi:hypothetical protein
VKNDVEKGIQSLEWRFGAHIPVELRRQVNEFGWAPDRGSREFSLVELDVHQILGLKLSGSQVRESKAEEREKQLQRAFENKPGGAIV